MKKTSSINWLSRRSVNWIALGLSGLAAIALVLTGVTATLEDNVRTLRAGLFPASASGEIVVVEIDGRSLQAINRWPWPRRHFAQAVEELDRLGVEQIAFDVDFSARSGQPDDLAFAEALEGAAAPIILPTFRQINRVGDELQLSESLPLPELRKNALLASVNVHPGVEGRIDFYPYGDQVAGTARPSLASLVTDSAGSIADSYRISRSVEPDTIPRISFVDLVEGRVSPDRVQGRRAIIGATAIELGDRYPTARHGVQPGVIIQAVAAETLLQDLLRADSGWIFPSLAVLVMLSLALRSRFNRWISMITMGTVGTLLAIALAFDAAYLAYVHLATPLVLLAGFLLSRSLLESIIRLREATLTDLRSGLPNHRAFEIAVASSRSKLVAVLRFDDFEQVEAILDSTALHQLDREIAKRLHMLAVDERIYRLERGLFGWIIPAEYEDSLEEHFLAARALFVGPIKAGVRPIGLSPHFGSANGSISDATIASEAARRAKILWSATAQEIQRRSQFEQRILADLRDGMDRGDIWVAYQPKLDIVDGEITSAECLVRWDHEELGPVSPAAFIPVLEEKSRTFDLTMFVVKEAIARIRECDEAQIPLHLSVNLSAQLLSDSRFIEDLAGILAEQALPKDALTLEVTESAPLLDADVAQLALGRLSDAGARISIDDYGTGQATLTYLQDFPTDEIKLDRAFISNLAESASDKILVQSTIEMGHALGFEIVAEGVEDEDTLAILKSLGCDYAQGWHIGKPLHWDMFRTEFIVPGEARRSAA